MSTVVLPLKGLVLTDQGTPFQLGQVLYRALAENYRVVIASHVSEEDAKGVMRRNGLLGWAVIREGTVLEALRKERTLGHIHFCITPDDEEAAAIFEQGITVLRISGSDFVNPKWRAEKRAWADIVTDDGGY